jgi:hypothetical protein
VETRDNRGKPRIKGEIGRLSMGEKEKIILKKPIHNYGNVLNNHEN